MKKHLAALCLCLASPAAASRGLPGTDAQLGLGVTRVDMAAAPATYTHGQAAVRARRGDDGTTPLGEAASWKLEHVFREVPSDDRVWLGFHITSDGYDPAWCYMLVHVAAPARVAAFADEPCVGSGFSASWGYREEEDAGILALRSPDKTRTAWFGWNNVNNSTDLPDVGPNATSLTEDV